MEPTLRIKKRRLLRDFSIIGLSVIVAIYIQISDTSSTLVGFFSSLYFVPAAILMGFLFSLTFTAAISTSVFILLAETTHNPFLIALLGGVGSALANSLIYKFFKEEIKDDIELIEPEYAKKLAHKIMHSKLFVGLLPYLAALILASPLPDELGILLLSGSNFKYTKFFILSFAFHTIGILAIVLLGKTFI
ncbi:MAG: hypothetical protein Q8P25_05300 [Candidatus Curtissbacteria bacterium]|nr:hypothetical protein [Candidatus Curtissbacteria bacterium]